VPTTALTPELALSRLGELSADIRDALVLDAAGNRLAGDAQLAGAAADLIAASGDAAAVEVADERGAVYAVRDHRHAIVAVTIRPALPSLMFMDLRSVLAGLAKDGAS
jgi:alkylhydroperoxidase family enzyme